MGVTATTRLPAGWYPDPEGGDHRRWWDGREWTQYTAEFQRPTSVDELDLEPAVAARKVSRKPAKADRGARKLRRVETGSTPTVAGAGVTEAEEPQAPWQRAAAVRIGRLLAGAVNVVPSMKRAGKRRRAHRSTR